MKEVPWFRRTTWTDQDRDEFNGRLARARRNNRAQYLRIQAQHLEEAGLHTAAIELLDRMRREFPDKVQLALSHSQIARSLAALGQTDHAIREFRADLQAERDWPNVRTHVELDFAWFAIERQLTDLYDEVSDVLEVFRDEGGLRFPGIEYRFWSAQAVLAEHRGESTAARRFAQRALAEAAKSHSGLRYHSTVGLVRSQPDWMEKRIRALAGN